MDKAVKEIENWLCVNQTQPKLKKSDVLMVKEEEEEAVNFFDGDTL